jgi:hypothetical protein
MDIWEVYYTPFSDTPTWICVQHKLLLRCILYATFEATALRKPRNRSRAKAKAIWASIWTFAKTGTPFFVTKKMVDLTWFKEQKLVICVGLWWSHLLEKRIVYIYMSTGIVIPFVGNRKSETFDASTRVNRLVIDDPPIPNPTLRETNNEPDFFHHSTMCLWQKDTKSVAGPFGIPFDIIYRLIVKRRRDKHY